MSRMACQGARLLLGVGLAFALGGCPSEPDRLPVKAAADLARPALDIRPGQRLAPIKLANVVVDIRRGTRIGSYLVVIWPAVPCNLFSGDYVFWNQGRVRVREHATELSDSFHETLSEAGYNVVGDPKRLFAEARGEPQPSYLVGARVENIAMEICDRSAYWRTAPLGRQSGKASIRVEWQVFDALNERVVYRTRTEGAAELAREAAVPDGELALLFEAFRNAASNLAADPRFLRVVSAAPQDPAALYTAAGASMRFTPVKPFAKPVVQNMDYVRLGVVTLSAAQSHGSGFFVSPRFVLTNHHVVRGSELVQVTLVTGRKVLGEVIRKHPQRDVALVSVEAGGHSPLPVRLESPLRIGEEVYAIGTPLDRKLSNTVTRGIVSAFRSNSAGLEDIQADVDIHGGNSGGPLLDASGNVVGIAYAGFSLGPNKTSVGLNLFIPIRDAIEKLGLAPDDPQTGRPAAGP